MRWSYKTIHYELKKEGILGNAFLDEPEVELSLNQYGKAGWELVSLLETMDGLIAVFKQPLDMETRSFPSPSVSPERTGRSPKEPEKKNGLLGRKVNKKIDQEELDEDLAEAILLDDEFEDVEEKEQGDKAKPSTQSVDVGMIRIE